MGSIRKLAQRWLVTGAAVGVCLGCAVKEPSGGPPGGGTPAPGETAREPAPEPVFTLTTAGIIAYYDGELKAAERLLRSAVNHDYGDTIARFYLAKAHAAQGGPEGRMAAESVLGELTDIAGTEPSYLLALARLRLRQGYRSNARRAFDKLLRVEPDDVHALYEVARLAEGDWWRFQARRDREIAQRYYRRVLDVDGTHRDANVRLAVLALEADSVEVARPHVDALLTHHADDVHATLLEGVRLEYDGDFEAAENVFDRALASVPPYDQPAYLGPAFLNPDSTFVMGGWGGLETGRLDLRADGSFWRRRDPTPATRVNERFVVHASRTAMADFIYGNPDKHLKGWETPPGEFYIRYGKPVKREYILATTPRWVHTFLVNGNSWPVPFYDYSLNGNFMHPIENNAAPIHAELMFAQPEDGRVAERVHVADAAHALAWFRGKNGEPRLEVFVAGSSKDVPYQAVLLDESWEETYRAQYFGRPRRVPASVSLPSSGLFDFVFHPGDDAVHLRMTVGDTSGVRAELGPALPPSGFALSELVVGFLHEADGFYPTLGYPIPTDARIGVEFEVYDIRLDALGIGYLDITLSVVPDAGRNTGVTRALFGEGEPSFVTSRFSEEVSSRNRRRVVELDPGALEPGRYTVEVEVEDTLTLEKRIRSHAIVVE